MGEHKTTMWLFYCFNFLFFLGSVMTEESDEDPCYSNPCQNGICVGHPENGTYHCYCEDGFTGVHCQTDWDECWSSPCQNEGVCIDQVADFNCTCQAGFTGKLCETNIDECLSDPCLNEGTCIDYVAGYMCECPRGFSGQNCEIDISVCNASAARGERKCMHGGKCIDGIGESFYCECAQGWSGETCSENVNECEEDLPCSNGGVCVDLPGEFLCSCPFGFAGDTCEIELEACDSNPCQNDALCFVLDDSFQCYCVPDYHGDRCQFKYDDCLLPPWPKCFNGGKCIDGVDDFTCSCPKEHSGKHCHCSVETDDCLDLNESISWTRSPDYVFNTTLPNDYEDEIEMDETTTSGAAEPIAGEQQTFQERLDTEKESTEGVTTTPESSLVTSTPTLTPVTSLFVYVTSDNGEVATRSLLAGDDFLITPTPVFGEEGSSSTIAISSSREEDSTSFYEVQPTKVPVTVITQPTVDMESMMTPTPPVVTTTTIESNEEEDVTEDLATTTVAVDQQEDVEEEQVYLTTATMTPQISSSEDDATSPHTEDTLSSTMLVSRAEDDAACISHVCRNGGTCFVGVLGDAECRCPLRYRGRQCEKEAIVETPGFVGHSLLVHLLEKGRRLDEGFQLLVSFKTSASDGVLFHAGGEHPDEAEVSAHISSGVLHLRVSCGAQNMAFVDPRLRVDDGNLQTIELELKSYDQSDGVETSGKCAATVRLNETHEMRGEQESEPAVAPLAPSVIYLGQMLSGGRNGIRNVGFRGCITHFQLDSTDVHPFADASYGRDVVECRSAACAVHPCQNGAVCAENRVNGEWRCNCPAGFTGELCERPVCAANPCRRGGTCLGSKTGPGFLCLCPLGTQGALCELKLDISQPSFTRSVGGYSSYLAYPVSAAAVAHGFNAQLHFTAAKSKHPQIALLFFLGHEGPHAAGDDYVAVSYVKGHVLLTWDLGSGPRRIFTKRPVDPRYYVHSVSFGLKGREAWLQVDRLGNVTGRAPGLRRNLNVSSQALYLGGHENHNLTFLPHDLPIHNGFEGCIFDFSLRGSAGTTLVGLGQQHGGSGVQGRNVFQCHTDVCDGNPCLNGGTCIGYGSSYICSCVDGWFGLHCQESSPSCTVGKHECAKGSECAVHSNGTYFCLCPLGKSGPRCRENLDISDPRFDGLHSTMSMRVTSPLRRQMHISLQILADEADGLVLFIGDGSKHNDDFLALSLSNSSLVLTVDLGGPRTASVERVLTLTQCCVTLGDWHEVGIWREGRKASLSLDDKEVATGEANRLAGLTLDVDHIVYLADSGWIGRAVTDCDGTRCGGETCRNGGRCQLADEVAAGFVCECDDRFGGERCDTPVVCAGPDACAPEAAGCRVDAVEPDVSRCDCPLGYGGDKCDEDTSFSWPRFSGDGHLRLDLQQFVSPFLDSTHLSLEIKPETPEGIILWLGNPEKRQEDYLGLGLRNGLLHLVWSLGGWHQLHEEELTVPDISLGEDGEWHTVRLSRSGQILELLVDGQVFGSQAPADSGFFRLDVESVVFIGGPTPPVTVPALTRGHFTSGFSGCLRNISVQNVTLDWLARQNDQERDGSLTGLNVDECQSSAQ